MLRSICRNILPPSHWTGLYDSSGPVYHFYPGTTTTPYHFFDEAYIGSQSEAEDAVQEAWLRLDRADTSEVRNLGGWLTTVVARVCLNMLQSRKARREESFGTCLPEPVAGNADGDDPEEEALLADAVGLALVVVLDTLTPAERLAFVLHDLFAVPFDEVAPIVGRSPAAARQLASRARRRVRGATPAPAADRDRQRVVVEAFLAAARGGDFAALLAVLDPDVVLRADPIAGETGATGEIRGAAAVATQALTFAWRARFAHPMLVNGAVGIVVAPHGEPVIALRFTIMHEKIIAIEIFADPARLRSVHMAPLDA